MSAPIALRADDDHKVYAYLCGVCRHLHAGAETMGKVDEPNPSCVSLSREQAMRCCRCERCKKVIGPVYPRICEACKPAHEAERAEIIRAYAQDCAKKDAATEASLGAALDRDAALALRELMSEVCEEQYCANWLLFLESELWNQVFGSGIPFGPRFPGDKPREATEESDKLRRLSEKAGGWWCYDESSDTEVFITTERWVLKYKQHREMFDGKRG